LKKRSLEEDRSEGEKDPEWGGDVETSDFNVDSGINGA
jgi:hypothetical protein